MKTLRGILAGLALMGAAAASSAPASAQPNWGGLYIGAHVGGAWTEMDWGLNYPNGNPPPSSSFDRDGSILGGHIGIQHQFGQWVLGAEVSLSDGFGAKNITGINLWSPQVGDLRTHMGPLVTATGRVGYSMNRWLGYVKAGFAGANIRLDADDNVPPDYGFSTRNFHNGWTAGVGVEHMFSDNVIFGLEYNYVDLGQSVTNTVVVLATGAPAGGTAASNVDTTVHAVTARISFKFGRPAAVAEPMK